MVLAHDTMVRCSQAATVTGHTAHCNAMQNAAKMNTDPRKHFEDMLTAADLWEQETRREWHKCMVLPSQREQWRQRRKSTEEARTSSSR